MGKRIEKEILLDSQIKKFSLYGLFKNLKFFEPYLLIYLLSRGINLLQIGILISIREIVVNVFEIPSGFIADYFGKRKELCSCFLFYIISFIAFYFTNSFYIAVIAIVFFGLGEAFRSGTHKAMIFTYLEHKDWAIYKTFVYGKTRSMSLIGSAISSLLAIVLVLSLPATKWIFLISILPYILDFVLILSYPKFLDKSNDNNKIKFTHYLKKISKSIYKNIKLKKLINGNAIYEGCITSIKDMIQPILEGLIIANSILLISSLNVEQNVKVILGFIYFVINILSSFASRNSYRLSNKLGKKQTLNILYIGLIIIFGSTWFFISNHIIVALLFVLINLFLNVRKPIFIDVIDDNMNKEERATVLSISSQIKSLFIIVIAPLIGYIALNFGFEIVMLMLVGILLISFPLTKI